MTKSVRHDCSHVPVWELAELLRKHFADIRKQWDREREWNLELWAESHGLATRQVRRIINMEVPHVGLDLVDRVCNALGGPHVLHTLTFIPGRYAGDALRMAREEYVATHDDEPSKEALSARAAELIELRSQILSTSVPQAGKSV